MQKANNTDALMEPNAKVFITPQFKTFIKSSAYKNENKKLTEVSVKFLTEEYEVQDVDYDKVYAENEFFHLRDTNEDIKREYEKIEELNKNREQIREVGIRIEEAKIKLKMLQKLKSTGKDNGQSDATFSEKFEKILKKQNSNFIEKLLKKMKQIEVGIGLEFPGSMQEEVTRGHQELIQSLTKMGTGMEVEVPKGCYHSFILDDGFLLNFNEDINDEGKIEWYTKFFEITATNNKKNLELNELKSSYEFRTSQRINNVKYFAEGNILIITSTLPEGEKNTIIQIFELIRNKDSVNFDPRHKIQTNGRFSEFVRAGGTEYLVYTNDLLDEEEFMKLNVMNFEETFVNNKVKPTTEKISLELKCFKTCNLGNGYIIGEGPNNTMALIDLSAKEALAYYKEHKGEDYFNYLMACYSKTKNLLFILHNSQNGAILSVFGVDQSLGELVPKQHYELLNDLKSTLQQSFCSRYFTLQFNHTDNRLDLTDDYQQYLFRYKLNEESKLVKDKDPLKIESEKKDCTPTFLMTRLEGDLYFLQYYTFSTYMKGYPVIED
jgi:hypothetical protein